MTQKRINSIINKGGKATFKTTKGDKRVEINEEDNTLTIDKKRYRYNRETKSLVNKLFSISNNLVSKSQYTNKLNEINQVKKENKVAKHIDKDITQIYNNIENLPNLKRKTEKVRNEAILKQGFTLLKKKNPNGLSQDFANTSTAIINTKRCT